MSTLYRAQILLDPDQYRRLRALAAAEKRSISELVRESADRYLSSRSADEALQRTLAAFDGLAELRARVEVAHGVLPAASLAEERKTSLEALQHWVDSLYGGAKPEGVVRSLIEERRREAAH